jgi:hypothetical protein
VTRLGMEARLVGWSGVGGRLCGGVVVRTSRFCSLLCRTNEDEDGIYRKGDGTYFQMRAGVKEGLGDFGRKLRELER